MDKNIDTYKNDIVIDENNEIVPLQASMVVYEDKTSIVPVHKKKKVKKKAQKKEKKAITFGIISLVFAAISLFSIMNVGTVVSLDFFITPIVAIISLLLGLVFYPFSTISAILFFITTIFIIGAALLNIAPQIVGLIFAAIDRKKNKDGTMVGNIGHTTSLVSLITVLASNLIAFVFSLVLAIIPIAISGIFALAKTYAFFAAIANFILPLFK